MASPAPPARGRVVVEVPAWFGALADRGVQAMVVLVAASAAGFAAIGLSWAGVAARLDVGLQMPFFVSGAFGGVAVAGAFLALAGIYWERRRAAEERYHLDTAIREAAYLSEFLPAVLASATARTDKDGAGSTEALVVNGSTLHRASCRMVAGKQLPGWDSDRRGLRACRICRAPLSPPA